MTDFIEQDALTDTTHATPPIRDHPEHEVTSFIATPRMDQSVLQKMMNWFKDDLKPSIHIRRKDGLRHMFIITSNSYEDRDGETITSDALKAYESSCYPGDDLFHCDNPLLWWHNDDVVMGEAVAVNYSEPFLIEVFRELPTAVSKVLFDYAEANEDNAGASHRFGYLEKDRDKDGTFHRIFKQETSYLPERKLAANDRTYAGVIMASPQSDKRLDEVFSAIGIADAAKKLHAKTGDIEKELSALGIQHKAFPPKKAPAGKPAAPVEADAAAPSDMEAVDDESVDEDVKSEAELPVTMAIFNQIASLVMDLVDSQMGGMQQMGAIGKAVKALEDTLEARQTAEKAHTQGLEDKLKASEARIGILEARLNLAPRSVQQQVGSSDPEIAKKQVSEAIDGTEKARVDAGKIVDPFWGVINELPKG